MKYHIDDIQDKLDTHPLDQLKKDQFTARKTLKKEFQEEQKINTQIRKDRSSGRTSKKDISSNT